MPVRFVIPYPVHKPIWKSIYSQALSITLALAYLSFPFTCSAFIATPLHAAMALLTGLVQFIWPIPAIHLDHQLILMWPLLWLHRHNLWLSLHIMVSYCGVKTKETGRDDLKL